MSSCFFLFMTAFGAASILPLASEPVLLGLVLLDQYSIWMLWLVASVGNTLGSVLNWGLARYALHWQHKRWFPVREQQLAKASDWFRRFGVWSLLLAWLPIIGDALTFAAGLLRVRLSVFLLLVGLGKAARYAAILWLIDGSVV